MSDLLAQRPSGPAAQRSELTGQPLLGAEPVEAETRKPCPT